MFKTFRTAWPEVELAKKKIAEKRESKPVVRDSPPATNPHHCPKCGTPGKYTGRQHQSEQYVLIAWKGCECGNTWGYTYHHDNLPDPNTLV